MAVKNLSSQFISQSFQRLLQLDPDNNVAILDGTGSTLDNFNIIGTLSASLFSGNAEGLTNLTASNISGFANDVSRSAAFYGFGAPDGGETNQNAFSFFNVSGSTIDADVKTDTINIHQGTNVLLIPDASNNAFTISAVLPDNIISSSNQLTNISTSSISDFDTEVSRSIAESGFGSGGGDWSELTNIPSNLVSSSQQTGSVLGLGPTDNVTFGTLSISGIVGISGSLTVFDSVTLGDSISDIHIFTGSIDILNNVTASAFKGDGSGLTNIPTSSITNFNTEVSKSAAFYGFSASGSVAATNWVDIPGKPSNIVSSSTQTIGNLNGTNIVSSSTQTVGNLVGEDININNLISTNGAFSGNVLVNGTLTAREFVVSSSVTVVTTSYSSGSTLFGDSLDDNHTFTGSVNITGSFLVNGTSISSFDGDRTVTRQSIPNVNVGTSGSINNFVEEYFFPFNPATVSLSNLSLYETGSSQNITVNVTVTENSETILASGSLKNITTDTEVGTFTSTDSIVDNGVLNTTLYSSSLYVDNDGSPTSIISNTVSASFIYPFFYGTSTSSSLSGTELYTGLTKTVELQSNKTLTYSVTDNYIYFVVPNSWDNITKITDPNSLDVTDSFTTSSVSVTSTGLDNNYTDTFVVYRSGLTSIEGDFNFQF